jgi:hypothetical protein
MAVSVATIAIGATPAGAPGNRAHDDEREKSAEQGLDQHDRDQAHVQHRQYTIAVGGKARRRVVDRGKEARGRQRADPLSGDIAGRAVAADGPSATRPKVMAGVMWPPEMCPIAKLSAMMVAPIDSATPRIAAPIGAANE